jgi:hypothetical protein
MARISLWNDRITNPSRNAEQYAKHRAKELEQRKNRHKKGRIRPAEEEIVEEKPAEPEPQLEPEPEAEPVQVLEQDGSAPYTAKRYKILTSRQRRRNCLSISVSEEEEEILRAHAAKLGKSFSSWARDTLFRSARRKIPARPQ